MNFSELHNHKERISLMQELSSTFKKKAAEMDETGSFPFENMKKLKESGYTSLTVPVQFGGLGVSLLELIQLQEKLAEGDGSTALAIGWHMSIIKNLGEKQNWNEPIFQELCQLVLEGRLVNSAASEAQTGSPTRGGKPNTTAEKRGNQWVITGRKTFTTMAPVLDFFIVSASILHSDEVGTFLIPRDALGVTIEETWDSIAMRGTGSHDLVLNNVLIEEKYGVEKLSKQKKANGSLLHIPACYLGIAQAAENEALRFANSYSPNSISGTINNLPNVQHKIGEMEYELIRSRTLLYAIADKWDKLNEEERDSLTPELGVVKMAITNSAIKVVDLAMRVVGARSLSQKSPLQRYYRDVRAGLHNPPMDDMTIQFLASNAIKRSESTDV